MTASVDKANAVLNASVESLRGHRQVEVKLLRQSVDSIIASALSSESGAKRAAAVHGNALIAIIKASIGSFSSFKQPKVARLALEASDIALRGLYAMKCALSFKRALTLEIYEQKLIAQMIKREEF